MQIIKSIQNRIYSRRGERVMLDRELAQLYEVETRVLNQAVKRNIKRFPEDFMFSLSALERQIMQSQIVNETPEAVSKGAASFLFSGGHLYTIGVDKK